MHIAKLRVAADEDGLVPAGQYFKRLSIALREANERAGNVEPQKARRATRQQQREVQHARHV